MVSPSFHTKLILTSKDEIKCFKEQVKQMKSKQELQLEAVKAIITGELFLEEAMVKYNVKSKRTMTTWIKKLLPLLEARTNKKL